MDNYTYGKPVTVRLNTKELEIIECIRNKFGRPGLELSSADAVKVALHDWEEKNKEIEAPFSSKG